MKKFVFAVGRRPRFIRVAMRSPIFRGLGLKELVWVLRGFNPESVRLLGLAENGNSGYVRDIDKKRVSRAANKGFSNVLGNKIEFQYFFENIFRVPPLYCLVLSGKISRGSPNYPGKDLHDALEEGEQLVLKPVFGGMSRGIHFVHQKEDGYHVNDRVLDATEFRTFVSGLDSYMVCPKIEQHADLSRIFPETTNTVRVLTVRDPLTGRIGIAMAIQNFGTRRSLPTDNFSRGGVCARVDVSTGVYGKAVRHAVDWRKETYREHPDTGEPITGLKLPNWELVKSTMIDRLEQYPFFDFVGWDIVISADDFFVIEGNHNPGNFLTQAHQPLLDLPELQRFYREKGVVDR